MFASEKSLTREDDMRDYIRDYFMERVRRLTPVFIQPIEGLPPADPDQVEEFGREFILSGTPAYRIAFYATILLLQALCLVTRRKSVYALSSEEADEFMQSLYSSRIIALNAIPTILGTTIYMAHYNRDDVQVPLGFDIFALREEAAKRGVER